MVIRFFLRPAQLHRPLHRPCLRTLTTRPRRIPRSTNTWDPSATKPNQNEPPNEAVGGRGSLRLVLSDGGRRTAQDTRTRTKGMTSRQRSNQDYALHRLGRFISLPRTAGKLRRRLILSTYRFAKAKAPGIVKRFPRWARNIVWDQLRPTQQRLYSRWTTEELYHDLGLNGRARPSKRQNMEYMESLFLSGNKQKALEEWEQAHRQPCPSPMLLERGARMYALVGNADRAREIMHELYDSHPAWGPDIMISVLRAHTRSEVEAHHKMARDIYGVLKERLGEKATLRDLDSCLVGFLEARDLLSAKQVFGDMVKSGLLGHAHTRYQEGRVLRRLHLLFRLGTDIAKATSIGLYAVTILPARYRSRIFGDWMKLAVIWNAPEAAAQILDMMFTHGCPPKTYHFNLALRALFRTKERRHELKAENLAWKMVEESAQSASRKANSSSKMELNIKESRVTNLKDQDLRRRVPPANAVTFALLMQHHSNHSQWEHVDYLARRMDSLQFQPDVSIMNVLMKCERARGNYNKVWEIYRSLTNVPEGVPGVFPDGASFRCLWLTMRLALGEDETHKNNLLPSPRHLLAEHMRWFDLVRNRSDAERFRVGLAGADHEALNTLTMHCFSYTQDLVGSLVAMHALRARLDIFPSHKAAQILQRQIAWVDMRRETKSARSQYSHSRTHAGKLAQMERIYRFLLDARFERKRMASDQDTNDYNADMSDEEIGELRLDALSEFIRVILKRQHPPEVVEDMIDEAKKSIGLPDLVTGDLDAFSVA